MPLRLETTLLRDRFRGALLGLAYALLWIGASWRAGAGGARTSASVHGVTAAIIAFPLVGEAATRLSAFSPTAAAIALAAVTAAFCASGVLTRLTLLVWIGVLAGAGTASGLFVATGAIATFVVFHFALPAGSSRLAGDTMILPSGSTATKPSSKSESHPNRHAGMAMLPRSRRSSSEHLLRRLMWAARRKATGNWSPQTAQRARWAVPNTTRRRSACSPR